jgi:serine/tyrosine/threonine adenylyltransferase
MPTPYANLPGLFYQPAMPTPVASPTMVVFNPALAAQLGLTAPWHDPTMALPYLSGNAVAPKTKPLAQAYAGHQFGHFTMLGDGRALLLAEHQTPEGQWIDIQLKGSGPTPYSRRGDGRAALGPMLREYIISEALHALGIPTTRSLAVVATGQTVQRETPLPGAVLTRIADSHLRVGTFEYAIWQGTPNDVQTLADFALQRHYLTLATQPQPYLALLQQVIAQHAALVAQWQCVGFIHGVMNTDNMTISGQTIDYGPCAFMDAYDPATVFSSIDRQGRYAYGNQPAMAHWNLTRLAEALLPLLHPQQPEAIALAQAALNTFKPLYTFHWVTGMRHKLGLWDEPNPDDVGLITQLLAWMQAEQADFTNTFRGLTEGELLPLGTQNNPAWQHWHTQWQDRLSLQGQPWPVVAAHMQAHNPAIIPRNHLVEDALAQCVAQQHDGPMQPLLAALASPFAMPTQAGYTQPGGSASVGYRTFCGT